MSKSIPVGISTLPKGVSYRLVPECVKSPHLFRVRDPHSGKVKNKSFADPKKGLKWAEGTRAGLEARVVSNGKVPWSTAVDDYVSSLKGAGKNEKYTRTVARIGEDLKAKGAGDITGTRFRTLVEEYIEGLVTAPGSRQPGLAMSAATRRTALAIIRGIVHKAVGNYRIPFDPVAGVSAPKVKKKLVNVMTLPEAAACLSCGMESNPYFLRFAIMAYLGVRDRDEGLMLQWEDFDPTIKVMRLRYHEGTTLKTGEREIPVPEELAAILRTAPKKGRWILSDAIRLGKNGKLVGDKTDYQRFKAYLRDAWMPSATSPADRERIERRIVLINRKSMRHLYARLQSATGVSHSTLKDRMGHTNFSTTMLYASGSTHFEKLVDGWGKGEFNFRQITVSTQALAL